MKICSLEDCDRDFYGKGLCRLHYMRQYRTGNPNVIRSNSRPGESNHHWKGDQVGYNALHRRVRQLRGSARDQLCVECGLPAYQWAYTNDDPNERVSPKGHAFSTDISRYQPMCVPCHKAFDKEARSLLV